MNTLSHHRILPRHGGSTLGARLSRRATELRHTLRVWIARSRSRRELRELDERLLRDIGVSRSEAERVGSKPFWRE